jgi:hypothetical protein
LSRGGGAAGQGEGREDGLVRLHGWTCGQICVPKVVGVYPACRWDVMPSIGPFYVILHSTSIVRAVAASRCVFGVGNRVSMMPSLGDS